ncbi:hypothetical protein XELAEV_18001724mg [Xenopus laevis]|nr:hypothetical protein XELAEV_18001724mg [Xenopus laevis]
MEEGCTYTKGKHPIICLQLGAASMFLCMCNPLVQSFSRKGSCLSLESAPSTAKSGTDFPVRQQAWAKIRDGKTAEIKGRTCKSEIYLENRILFIC